MKTVLNPIATHITLGLVLFGQAILPSPVSAQSASLKPGQYETVTEVSMPGRASQAPPRKKTECLAARDLKELTNTIVKDREGQQCTLSDYAVTGTTLKFTKTCMAGSAAELTSTVEVVFTSAESYRAVVNVKGTSGRAANPLFKDSTITVTGKRIGECTK
jgi:hypothetical protein